MHGEMEKPLVSVICITYNQRRYIEETIDSFRSQITTFPFEIIVHDDASTDGTTEYLRAVEGVDSRVRCIIQEANQFSNKSIDYIKDYLLPAAKGRYIAFCEGDDFWIDKNKLQKQFDYMEANPGCTFCFTRARVIDGVSGDYVGYMGQGEVSRNLSASDLVRNWNVPTASTFFRKNEAIEYYETCNFYKPAGDFPRAVYLTAGGFAHYDSEPTSVYRFSVPGSMTSAAKHNEDVARIEAVEWIAMLSALDECLGRRLHKCLVEHAGYYVSQLSLEDQASDHLAVFVGEARASLSVKQAIRKKIVNVLRFFGFRIVKVRFSGLMKWRLEKM